MTGSVGRKSRSGSSSSAPPDIDKPTAACGLGSAALVLLTLPLVVVLLPRSSSLVYPQAAPGSPTGCRSLKEQSDAETTPQANQTPPVIYPTPTAVQASSSLGSAEGWAQQLHQAWANMYGLNGSTVLLPPAQVGPPPNLGPNGPLVPPLAPHLEECAALTAKRESLEKLGPNGELPEWALESQGSTCSSPSPPWVRGGERDNIPHTREAQRDLWVHQFGRGNCTDPSIRFLVGHWGSRWTGLGSSLHLMSVYFSLAYASDRIFVLLPPFHRALHNGCKRIGMHGKLECYTFPITTPACTARALELMETQPFWDGENGTIQEAAANKSIAVVTTTTKLWGKYFFKSVYEASGAKKWGEPWKNMSVPFEFMNKPLDAPYHPKVLQANWFRAQITRFTLRWPSLYLCQLINKERHEVYGLRVAREVAESQLTQRQYEAEGLHDWEKEMLGSNARENVAHGESLERTLWRFPEEPFLFHPIISIHVRQGDKGKEMKLNSFKSYMWLASRVRQHSPGVRYIWLSTEMQDVVNETASYPSWTFLYSDVPRQVGSLRFMVYETQTGVEKLVGVSFANLFIAAQCDFFVGPLKSNWNRLINELRLTNGREKSGYMALNHAEW